MQVGLKTAAPAARSPAGSLQLFQSGHAAQQAKRAPSHRLLTDPSDGLIESLVTIAVIVILGLSLLFGAIWGF